MIANNFTFHGIFSINQSTNSLCVLRKNRINYDMSLNVPDYGYFRWSFEFFWLSSGLRWGQIQFDTQKPIQQNKSESYSLQVQTTSTKYMQKRRCFSHEPRTNTKKVIVNIKDEIVVLIRPTCRNATPSTDNTIRFDPNGRVSSNDNNDGLFISFHSSLIEIWCFFWSSTFWSYKLVFERYLWLHFVWVSWVEVGLFHS
jgi:hypothetical protein